MAKQASPNNPISHRQFSAIAKMLNFKEIDPNGTVVFDGVAVPMSKIMERTVVTVNGKQQNHWTNLPRLNAKMASDLLGFLVKLPNKNSGNGPVQDGGTAGNVGGWDSF